MAISKKGNKNLNGKLGNKATYELKTQMVTRTIGISKKKPTKDQLRQRQVVKLVNILLNPVKPFINVGFDLITRGTKWSPYNKATSENMLHAIIGVYPKQEIDFTKVTFSKGNMPVIDEVSVDMVEDGLEFNWNPNLIMEGMSNTDRVMLVAFCPAKKFAFYQLDGERRVKGKDHLHLTPYPKKVIVHTYLAFISADRRSISDTIYTGEIFW